MAGHRLPALLGKDVVGPPGECRKVQPPSGFTYTPQRRGGTSLGYPRAGPAYATSSAAEELKGDRSVAENRADGDRCSVIGSFARLPRALDARQ